MRTLAIRKLRAYVKRSWHDKGGRGEREEEEQEERGGESIIERCVYGCVFYRSATEKFKYAISRTPNGQTNRRTDVVQAAAGEELSAGETQRNRGRRESRLS